MTREEATHIAERACIYMLYDDETILEAYDELMDEPQRTQDTAALRNIERRWDLQRRDVAGRYWQYSRR